MYTSHLITMALFGKLKIILLALFIAFQNERAVLGSESKRSLENDSLPSKDTTGVLKSRSYMKPARVYRISSSETPSLTNNLMSTAGTFEPFSTSNYDLKNTQSLSKIKGEVNGKPRSGNLNTKKISIMKYSSNDDETPSTTEINEHYEWTSPSGSLNPELTTDPEIQSSAWSNFDSIENKAMARINDKTGSNNFWLTNLPDDGHVTSTQQNTNGFQNGNFDLSSNGDGKNKFSSWSTKFPEHEANFHPDVDELSTKNLKSFTTSFSNTISSDGSTDNIYSKTNGIPGGNLNQMSSAPGGSFSSWQTSSANGPTAYFNPNTNGQVSEHLNHIPNPISGGSANSWSTQLGNVQDWWKTSAPKGGVSSWLTTVNADGSVTYTYYSTNGVPSGVQNSISNIATEDIDSILAKASPQTLLANGDNTLLLKRSKDRLNSFSTGPATDSRNSMSTNPTTGGQSISWTTLNPTTSWSEKGMNGQALSKYFSSNNFAANQNAYHRQDKGNDHDHQDQHVKVYNTKQQFDDQEYEKEGKDDQQRRHGTKRRHGHKIRRGKTSSPSSEYPGLFTLNRLTKLMPEWLMPELG